MVVRFSFNKKNAITADTGGTRKKSVEVLLTDPALIKYIRIVNAPNETRKI